METVVTETKKKRKTAKIVCLSIAAALVLGLAAVIVHYLGLKPIVIFELGDPLPDVSIFGRQEDHYDKDYGILPLGDHIVKVVHNGIPTPVFMRVRDSIAPTAEPRALTITYGTTVTPDRLVTRIRDESIIAVTFSEPFDFDRIGDFPVTIVLEDSSGNRTEVQSNLIIRATVDEIALEAGAPLPAPDAFVLEGVDAKPVAEPTEDMLHHVGTYPVRFSLKNGQVAPSKLVVSDTVPPKGEGTFLWVSPDDLLTPDMLVLNPFDETDITYSYKQEPDPAVMHVQDITVCMTDEGGNETEVVSQLVLSRIQPVTVEASKEPLTPDMLGGEGEIAITEPFVPDTPGIYTIPVTVNGIPDYVLLTAKDTTPPKVVRKKTGTMYTMHSVEPDMVFRAEDVSPVTLKWTEEPDWTLAGEQPVRVTATDRFGNETVAEDKITLKKDTEPPVMYGVINRTSYVGESIAYLAEVYAEDSVDGRTQVTVKSNVIPDKAGTYRVVYSSVDASGNKASASCEFRLVESTVSEEEVHALAKSVLESITTEDMVTAEKMKAIFEYVRKHVSYVGKSDKTDWRKEAVRGIKSKKGDCFTFYSVTRALLDELGVEYMSVTRLGSRTRHYWVIVNIGTGWYHFDPTLAPRHKHKCFMWTNEQCKVKAYFWRYDQSKYPEIAKKKFDYDEVVRMEKEGLLP